MAHVEDRWIKDGARTSRYGRGMRYKARWIGPDGREKSKAFPDRRKKEAQEWGDDQEAAIRSGTWTDPDAGRTTLAQFAEEVWLPSLTRNPTTWERYEYQWRLHIKPALGGQQLGYLAAHPSVIQQWVKGLTMAASSAKVILDVLSGILSAALDDGYISRNPVRSKSVAAPVQDQARVIPWTPAQVAAVRLALPVRYRAMLDCSTDLGLRQGEQFGFSPDDVDWLHRVCHVRRQVKFVGRRLCFAPPKGGKERDIPVPSTTLSTLATHIQVFPVVQVTLPWADEAFVRHLASPGDAALAAKVKRVTVPLFFTTVTGKAVRRADFDSRVWVPAITTAGLARGKANGTHGPRHYFASRLLAGGLDVRRLAAYLGHHDPGFTLRTYTHLMPGPDSETAMRSIIDAQAGDSGDGPTTAQAPAN